MPPVVIERSPGGSQIYCNFGHVALAMKQSLNGGKAARIAMPGKLLEEVESSRQGIVTIEVGRATWEQSGSSRESKWTLADAPNVEILPLPKSVEPNDRTLLHALFECGKTTLRDSAKFAMEKLQIHGRSGRIAGTDGRQLLIWNGFDIPFGETLLVPAIPFFGHRELATANEACIGKTATHVVVTVGPWTVWLRIDVHGRFPQVESVVPRDAAHVLHLDEGDRQRAAEFCASAGTVEGDPVSITVELGPMRALRRKSGPHGPAEELPLRHSRSEGEPVTFVLNRDHFLRALSFGLCEIRTPSKNGPVVFQDKHRTYVTTALASSQAIPAIRPPATTTSPRRNHVIPISEGVPSMASETNGHAAALPDSVPPETLDFMVQAEGLRDALFDVARRANRLVAMLKQVRKQRRVLETAWSSLKNLRLGS